MNRYERQDGENEPIGTIFCSSGNHREQIELLEMDKDGIMVALISESTIVFSDNAEN
ncbi:MAG: hypothetical protein FWC91_14125 [Defluviitaleaceae bacterium]|nr:hypothetical protein [Defluviitaleaceae bacterium]